MITLAAAAERVDGSWTDAAQQLSGRGLLNQDDVGRIALLDAYGAMIANTDRHRFNVLLFPDRNGYSLAPAFDQLPMAYAPPASGHFRNTAADAVVPTVNTLAVWDQARELAKKFWRSALDGDLSAPMSRIVREHAER